MFQGETFRACREIFAETKILRSTSRTPAGMLPCSRYSGWLYVVLDRVNMNPAQIVNVHVQLGRLSVMAPGTRTYTV